ncbi:hypothetical protein DID77_02835 [Candidatus Marinamargulisbacteria bacterium SCGC AG-439-L15]|nr:hypothetical protein DID77_02835 [Candidatus Marinamargulisbacteria bacterium SCGC AG-439-L15]
MGKINCLKKALIKALFLGLVMPVLAFAGPFGLPGLHVNAIHTVENKLLNSATGVSVEADFLGYGIGIGYLSGNTKSRGNISDTGSSFISKGAYSMVPIYGYKMWSLIPLLADIKVGAGMSLNTHSAGSAEEAAIKTLKNVDAYDENFQNSFFLFAGVNVTPFPGVLASLSYWYHPVKNEASFGKTPAGVSVSSETYDLDLSGVLLSVGYGF